MTGDVRAGFSAHTSIKRSDFGLTWNAVLEAGGVAVSDKVEINLDIQAFRPA
jgi:polyisoprenoid-binding protein YceI